MGRLVGRAVAPASHHIEGDEAEDAIRGSIKALRGMGDWTENAGELSAFPYGELRNHAKPEDFARALIDRARRHRTPHRPRRRGSQSR